MAAVRGGLADSVVYEASREMAAWNALNSRPREDTWSAVHEQLDNASKRIPDSPIVHELMGDLNARRVDHQEFLDEANVRFRKALELRPTSPYTWANLAELMYRTGNTGAAFEAAISRAAFLGPAEPEVQRTVISLGLAVLDEVKPATRATIEAMVTHGMRRNPLETLQIADRRGRLDIACRHLADTSDPARSKWLQVCPSMEATQ